MFTQTVTFFNTKNFGWLRLELDERGRVIATDFVVTPGRNRVVPKVLAGALMAYLKTGKTIPKKLYRFPTTSTDFQSAVWRAVADVPSGQTITYAELARGTGRPQAVRAVGTACGQNPLALFIPCHRVVRKQGGCGNYAWGSERKRALLRHEAICHKKRHPSARRSLAKTP